MFKKHILNKNIITVSDIQRRHPRYLTCDTDKMYADLANEIFELLHEDLSFMEPTQVKNACISLTLYLEDIHSRLHLFDTFTQMYQKMFGCYLPFYFSTDKNAPDAELDAMRFMIWHSCSAEREGQILNPSNEGLKSIAEDLLSFWKEKKDTILPNVELADYIYSEETQTDVNEVKTVLIWLSRYYSLGHWYTNETDSLHPSEIKQLIQNSDKGTIDYATDCYAICEQRTWPLSVSPQHVYAEMIRMEMDDPNDELASTIENLKFKPFGIYELTGYRHNEVCLKDFLGNTFHVSSGNFLGDVKKFIQKNTHLAGSFICMDDTWHLNGPCIWSKPPKKDIDEHLDEVRQRHHYMNDFRGQYDEFINTHNGERLYFFRNSKGYTEWIEQELGLSYEETPLNNESKNKPMAIFFEDNGQMTIITYPQCIKHPNNPCYAPLQSSEEGIGFIASRDFCSPGCTLHLIEHDLLPKAMFNDIRGREYGRKLMQENMDFIARCMRRDITTDVVFRKRNIYANENDNIDFSKRYGSKHSYNEFVELISAEKSFRSKAHKEWKVVRANHTTTIIQDVKHRLNHEFATRDLYEAHLALDSQQIQVATLVPFVGKEKAPAASALLYNIVGQGQTMNNLRKLVDKFMKGRFL